MLALPTLPQISGPPPSFRLQQELDKARLSQLLAHLPLLYSVLGFNVLSIAFMFSQVAPPALTYGAASLLALAGLIRAFFWFAARDRAVDPERAAAMLKSVHRFVLAFALAYTAWTLALFSYGGDRLHIELVFMVVITNFISSFTLAHLPRVALTLSAITAPVFLLLLPLFGGAATQLIAVNLMMLALFFGYITIGSARDLAKLVDAQLRSADLADENRRLANTDSLTGLPNRREFFELLGRAMDAEPAGVGLVVGVIDLDGFKPINDLYGHAVGDRVLKECAARLKFFTSAETAIARLGGDEFALFLRGARSDFEILDLGAQIAAALRASMNLPEFNGGLSASIGFARYPQDAMDAHRLYERADYALYFGKQHRRGEPVLFVPEHETKMLLNARIQNALRNADLDKEISVAFQPLLDVQSRRIVGFEALARWSSPELGVVPPDLFIPVAERSETIHRITRVILRKAIAAARDWPDDIGLSCNLSVRDLASGEAILQIIALIESSGFDPGRLEIEVTETALVADFDLAVRAIEQLKAFGLKISLDDFGAGYSSLSYIHHLPVDRIKIDRSFIHEMQTSPTARDIVRSVIGLCDNLKLNCATEGVETVEQFDLLREYGCDVIQGYFISAPVEAVEVAGLIAANRKPIDRLGLCA
ncbi:putative bifunctional diguanylate cyclase/phosphodiesterase [Rhodoblastus sp.]|uniref:putative bifunctional diguanylate cyclase/phosphodiesterase n=1 Tax=Rhodoblastus sp. TaxID=1962975 RepID=UPI003F9E3E8B